jgi:HTH DNA binding domain
LGDELCANLLKLHPARQHEHTGSDGNCGRQQVSLHQSRAARPQGREGAREKLEGFCQVIDEALAIANMDLDRLILARELMNRVTKECRSNSKLPGLVELFLSRPLVTGPLAAKLLKVTPKAVDLMLAQLGGALPRELTGRTRYRAWGIV